MLVITNILFQQHKRWLYTWTSPDDQYWNQIDYILCSWRWRSPIQSTKQDLELTGSDHEFLFEKFRLKLEKVAKTTRLLRYDLNQIPMIIQWRWRNNRFKGLDLVDRVPEKLWKEVPNIVQEAVTKTIPKIKEMQQGKVVVWGAFTNRWEKKRSKT